MTTTARRRAHHQSLGEIEDALAADDLLLVLSRSGELARRAARSGEPEEALRDLARLATGGTVALLVAIEAVAELQCPGVEEFLVDHLSHPESAVRRHAAWRLGARRPTAAAYAPLTAQVVAGGIDTLHGHRTLRRWSRTDPEGVIQSASRMMELTHGGAARARLADLVGTIDHPARVALLAGIAVGDEHDAARIAAVGALGELRSRETATVLSRLAVDDGPAGIHAALALDGLMGGDRPSPGRGQSGLRIAQLVLAGDLDGQLSLGGRGDTGGVASLLVSLGEALVRRDDVDEVLTIGRGTPLDSLTSPVPSDVDRPSYGMISFDADRTDDAAGPWEFLPAIERGLRRQLRLAAPIDVLHLRMADVGTLAGATVARQLQIPICFSVAPDPHNVLRSLQSRGELDHDTFVALDNDTHVWFRARMVERLTRDADQLALFPRSRPTDLFGQLGLDESVGDGRSTVVAEGIDTGLVRQAEEQLRAGDNATARPVVLDELAELIPAERRHLPLLVSVGRLNPVKGMERVVRAWAADPRLRARCNLVIIGGDLANPSPTEHTVLSAIDRALPVDDPHRSGLVLFGGRPRTDIAALLVASADGSSGRWAAGGVYVDGALKEEFGLAVIEALAAGLPVVAPSTGGPPTYVDHGDTGILADPDADLAAAVLDAFDLVDRPGSADRARKMVEERYSIDTMAGQLAALYQTTVVVS